MSWNDFEKDEILKFAKCLGLGFYRVTKEGQFVECDKKAREIFGIPQDEKTLSKYSITQLYAAPAERGMRIDRLIYDKSEPLCGTLYLRIKGENKLLLDICRFDESYEDEGTFLGFVSGIEESTIFPKMFNTFPMGLYEVNEEDRIVRVNKKLVDILKYTNKKEILAKHFKDICEDEKKWEIFNNSIKKQGSAQDILRLRDANQKIIEVECFSQLINEFGTARWGMINDVTERESYVRIVEKMPTGFFHIEYAENDENHEHERLIQCNDCFAQILGYLTKEETIGVNLTKKHHPDKKESEKFFKELHNADKRGKPLLNHRFKTNKVNGEPIHISVDVHLVKDSNGNVIGREGTIRDITEELKIWDKEEWFKQTTKNTNEIIHAFLHPVIKFAGNSELQHQVINALLKTIPMDMPDISDRKKLGEILKEKLNDIKQNLKNNEDIDPLVISNLEEKISKIINVFDYSLQTEESNILLERKIRDTALWMLEELIEIGYFDQSSLKSLVNEDFIPFLQGILFNYLNQSTNILRGETEMMKREMEALRSYFGEKKKREYIFSKQNIGKILEENIERFKPVLQLENIEIEYKSSGNLDAEISANDIDRVICNLFHNAKKYSFKGKRRFVKVKARELQPLNQVEISIQSFGIPIKKEEIDSGIIWEFGYRGELAYAFDRDGVGAGLTDAKDVVEAHQGEINITSHPPEKFKENQTPGYQIPYLTTVKINLPKSRKENPSSK